MSPRTLSLVISLSAISIALIHLIWPELTIDTITMVLLIIAVIPWLVPLVKTLEFPGGWKVEFHELKKAADRADTAGLLADEPTEELEQYAFQSIAPTDPNLALAGLRIELEKRLALLLEANALVVHGSRGIGKMLKVLTKQNVMTREERAILSDMANMLNAAVHGAYVDKESAQWAIEIGPRLLASLDERARQAPIPAGSP